jgi:uncharacterized protein (DUF488 family)
MTSVSSSPQTIVSPLTLWTIGHSSRSIEEFISLLRANQIQTLADVRRFPGSKRLPHFGATALKTALTEAGISYLAFSDLGGRRQPRPDSVNTAWRDPGFRGYADYMETAAFQHGIARLSKAARCPAAIMCAERLWRHCHRSLIADFLKAAGAQVVHIEDAATAVPHTFTDAAHVIDGQLSYRLPQSTLDGFG